MGDSGDEREKGREWGLSLGTYGSIYVNIDVLVSEFLEAIGSHVVSHVHKQLLIDAAVRVISAVDVARISLPHKPAH